LNSQQQQKDETELEEQQGTKSEQHQKDKTSLGLPEPNILPDTKER